MKTLNHNKHKSTQAKSGWKMMKILQLCKKFPYPLKDGESIAVSYLSKAMDTLGCEVSLLSMNTSKHYFQIDHLPDSYSQYRHIYFTDIDNRLKWHQALANLFSKKSYHISRFESKAFELMLVNLLKNESFDIIQLETLYLTPYIQTIRKYSKAKIVMRAHNVEHEIWERIAMNTKNPIKKKYLQHLTGKLKQYELSHLNDYDLLVPITKRDLDNFVQMGYKGQASVLPIGLETDEYHANFASFEHNNSIAFIGSLDWMPNVEGLNWFLAKVWPELLRRRPALKLHIAGRNTPDSFYQMRHKNVIVEGEVPDAHAFINQHSMMIVPLFSGSGMRAKILEGMALGKVVVSTELGLEGIFAEDNKECLIANDALSFIQKIDGLLGQADNMLKIGKNARKHIFNKYDNLRTTKRLLDVYTELCSKKAIPLRAQRV